jgi:hypothetical protein
MFERFVLFEREELEIGRRYIQAFGLPKAVAMLMDDMNAGRLPWGKARDVLSHMPYLVVEYICRRVGFTRFRDVCMDPEFITLQGNGAARLLQRHVAFPVEGPARPLEDFAWHCMRHWHLVAHDLAGRHTYEVAPALADRLRQPELLDRPWQSPRVPVAAMLLIVPAEAQLTLAQWGAPPRAVTELYVVESAPPEHQWSVWIHAPVDEDFAEALHVELPFAPGSSLEDGIELSRDVFQGSAPTAQGWKDCVRWLAAAMRYLAEGSTRPESQASEGAYACSELAEQMNTDPPVRGEALRARLKEMAPGRRVLMGDEDILH